MLMAEACVLDRPHSQNARVTLKVPGITPKVLIETMRGEAPDPLKSDALTAFHPVVIRDGIVEN
jgi:hypothetical protein